MSDYVVAPLARNDLDEIWHYSVGEWGVTQAVRYLRDIQHAIEALVVNPELGRRCDDIRPGYRKHLVGSHILFYKLEKRRRINIVRILHQKMDVERHV